MKNKYFTEKERYQLEAYLKMKLPVAQIAKEMGKCRQTIYNEIKRGTVKQLDRFLDPQDVYCADVAQNKYENKRKNKGIDVKINGNIEMIRYIEYLLIKKRYSPYAVSAALKDLDMGFDICEKTIYNYINKGLFINVTQHNICYRKRKIKHKPVKRIALKNPIKPMIDDRDPEIAKRSSYGHWEMDTVYSGTNKSKACLLVLTERMSRQEYIIKIPDKTTLSVVKALDKLEKLHGKKAFRETFKTITCDNGVEFADLPGITKGSRTKLYYCHPYCSSERGSNENANKLIRRWIPKGSDIGKYSNKEIKAIQEWINEYPRKLFDGLSSNQFVENAQINCFS